MTDPSRQSGTRDLANPVDDREDAGRFSRSGELESGEAMPAAARDTDPDTDTAISGEAVATERPTDGDADGAGDEGGPLLATTDADAFHRRWEEIQTGFIDDPRQVVEEADQLVATVMRQLAESFASERERLEGHWDRGEEVSTEDLRVALQRYRSFFRRLLST